MTVYAMFANVPDEYEILESLSLEDARVRAAFPREAWVKARRRMGREVLVNLSLAYTLYEREDGQT